MNLTDCYIEEDLFPKIFTNFEERDYGILFYNSENKDSFDSNHAVIYRERIQNLQAVLLDIAEFYKAKGSRPIIYQSMLDDNWFDEIKDELAAVGYKSWTENQEFMFLEEKNIFPPILNNSGIFLINLFSENYICSHTIRIFQTSNYSCSIFCSIESNV